MVDFEGAGAAGVLGGEDHGAGGGDAGGGAGGDQGGAEGGGTGDEGGGVADPDWYGTLAEQPGEGETASNRDWVKSKGFKDLDGLVKAQRDTEKALRDGGRVKVPGEGASDEERAAFAKAIGVPDDPKGYEVKLPETNGGLELDGELIGSLAEIAHKAGVPKGGFEAIANAYVEQQVAQHLETVAREDAGREAVLKEWGAQQGQKIAEANAAMRALALTKADIASMQLALGTPEEAGSSRVLKILQKIGAGIAEDVLSTGGTGRFGVTATEAQVQVDQMKKDPAIAEKVMKEGTPENVRYNRLLDIIGAAEVEKRRGG